MSESNSNSEQIYAQQDEKTVMEHRFIIYINITAFSFKAELRLTFAFRVNDILQLKAVLEAIFHPGALLNQN